MHWSFNSPILHNKTFSDQEANIITTRPQTLPSLLHQSQLSVSTQPPIPSENIQNKITTSNILNELWRPKHNTETHTNKKRNASAVAFISEYTIFVKSCHVMRPVWPKPDHNHFNTIKHKCCTWDEIAKQHNIPEAKHASC